MRRIKIFVTGAEGIGWALDTEYALARQAFSQFADLVEAPEHADVIHTVWPQTKYKSFTLEDGFGEVPVVLALNNDPFALAHVPNFIDFARRHYYLVAQSSLAQKRCEVLGFGKVPLVPIIADLNSYCPIPKDDAELTRFADFHHIPRDKYLIGLLQRDSLGSDLNQIKVQKGPDIFVAIICEVIKRIGDDKIHIILGGPRRHWIRRELTKRGIPFTFVGKITDSDDNPDNILDKKTMNLLYNLIDLYLIPTRWEGAPRQVFDVSVCQRKILSSPVGIAPEILEPYSIYQDIIQAADRIVDDIKNDTLKRFIPIHFSRVTQEHSPLVVSARWKQVYEDLFSGQTRDLHRFRRAFFPLFKRQGLVHRACARLDTLFRKKNTKEAGNRIMIWQDQTPDIESVFQIQPALRRAFERLGSAVVSGDPQAVKFHIMDLGHQQCDHLQKLIELPSIKCAIVRIPSRRDAWPEIASMIRDRNEFVMTFANAFQLGSFVSLFGPTFRSIVIPPFFDVSEFVHYEQPSDEEKQVKEVLIVANETLDTVLTAQGVAHKVLANGNESAREMVNGNRLNMLVSQFQQATLFVADRYTPLELISLALYCCVPVLYDKSNPFEEHAISACLGYDSTEEIPALMNQILEHRARFRRIISVPTSTETAAAYLSALGLQ